MFLCIIELGWERLIRPIDAPAWLAHVEMLYMKTRMPAGNKHLLYIRCDTTGSGHNRSGDYRRGRRPFTCGIQRLWAAEVKMGHATWMQLVVPLVVHANGRSCDVSLETNRDDPG